VTVAQEVIYQAFQSVYSVFDCLYFYFVGVITVIVSREMYTSVTPLGVQRAFDVKPGLSFGVRNFKPMNHMVEIYT